jgi:hypothetical protein
MDKIQLPVKKVLKKGSVSQGRSYCKALRNNFCFGTALLSRVTSITRETRVQRVELTERRALVASNFLRLN